MYRQVTALMAYVTIVLGLAMIVLTLARGLGIGLVLGVLFVAAGAGRLFILRGGAR